ncbi:MAG: sigma 54-interacting transcriptional regulator [Gammaproteobacteria bacterium]|nr:sigma 54-interacting transcriptional regulator [Gammaproteobacteria bacterium]
MLSRVPDIPELAGNSQAVKRIRENFEQLAADRSALLLSGERGTGKEEIARALHRHVGGTLRTFVVADVSESPPAETEALLFGDVAAFSRATAGTVYIDEVGTLIPTLQSRLLRVLQEKEYYPPGVDRPVKTGARVVAASTQDLRARSKAGLFNAGLLEELSRQSFVLPALRSRREDLPVLIQHYLTLEASELSTMSKSMSAAAIEKLATLDWPGNLPQLESVCRRTTAFTDHRVIDVDDLPDELWHKPRKRDDEWSSLLAKWASAALEQGESGLLSAVVPQVEKILILAALEQTGGQKQEAARLLGWGRNTLTRKIKDLGVEAHRSRQD